MGLKNDIKCITNLFLFLLLVISSLGLEVNVDYGDPDFDAMLNMCINSTNHKKSRPGPEDKLHQQVTSIYAK